MFHLFQLVTTYNYSMFSELVFSNLLLDPVQFSVLWFFSKDTMIYTPT